MARLRDEEKLQGIALKLRRDIIEMIHRAGSGHPGGSLSAVEIVSALFLGEMNYDPDNIKLLQHSAGKPAKAGIAPGRTF